MTHHTIRPEVAQSLAAKLDAFCATLTPDELAAFEQIEVQLGALAGAEPNDVQGYMFYASPEVVQAHHQDMLHKAEMRRKAQEAVDGAVSRGDRKGFWASLLGNLGTGEAGAPAPRLRPATGGTTAG